MISVFLHPKKSTGHFLYAWQRKNNPQIISSYIYAQKKYPVYTEHLVKTDTAGDRGRTGTGSLPRDFKSRASANSATAAYSIYIESDPNGARTHDLRRDRAAL